MSPAHATVQAGCEAIYDSLEALVPSLDDADWTRETGCPGWDVADNLAHIVTLEQVVLGDDLTGHAAPTGLPHVRDEFGQYMEDLIDAWRGRDRGDLLDAMRTTFARRREQMAAWSDDDWADGVITTPLGGSAAPGRFLPIRVFDMWAHEQDIRRAVSSRGHLEGPAVDVSLTRCARGFGNSFSKGLGEPTKVVELRVSGPSAHVFTLDLATGRASDGAAGSADLTISGDIEAIVALGCGRSDAPDPGTLSWTGDEALAASIRQHLAFTP